MKRALLFHVAFGAFFAMAPGWDRKLLEADGSLAVLGRVTCSSGFACRCVCSWPWAACYIYVLVLVVLRLDLMSNECESSMSHVY